MNESEILSRLGPVVVSLEASASDSIGSIVMQGIAEASFCESPIERILCASWFSHLRWIELAGASCGGRSSFKLLRGVKWPENIQKSSGEFWRIDTAVIQARIDKFRVDLAIARCEYDPSTRLNYFSRPIMIECDGHAFHERTKAQAAKDKSRDRQLQAGGFSVLRFTGSEIWADPSKCVRQIEESIETDIDKQIQDALAKESIQAAETLE